MTVAMTMIVTMTVAMTMIVAMTVAMTMIVTKHDHHNNIYNKASNR
eukprot:CAMPEP_0185924616 /NCGR_PEP_ID=MMETSP0924C-20121207/12655_1 /TAXON_ID=321610 /ORGANISM="Perkinsus chesapeaki, Strain ATCC PRA-65" /LENGTH=45 /DNA_ID= /DNA_START= /DNA_END= /DNA_ORIENTATION=